MLRATSNTPIPLRTDDLPQYSCRRLTVAMIPLTVSNGVVNDGRK
jgi:hypothetical protein